VLILGLVITICWSLYLAISVHMHTDFEPVPFHDVLGIGNEVRNPLDLLTFSNLRIGKYTENHHVTVVDISFLYKTPNKSEKYIDQDYGGLNINFPNNTWGRNIIEDGDDEEGRVYDRHFDEDDWMDPYYAFDDDFVRNPECRRVSWYRFHHPNCNIFHEIPMSQIPIVNHGYYRDVFNHTDEFLTPSASSTSNIIIKKMRYSHNDTDENFEFVRMDAIVMERLTSSPRIADIFGHCGSSIMQQAFEADIQDIIVPGSGYLKHHKLNDTYDVDPQNVFNPSQKLKIALDLAQPIADLHGFKDGVITHNDVQLCQYLYSKDNKLTLNDFNRAEIMLWDEDENKYCKYRSGRGHGTLRSPEEYIDANLDEKIDVFSYGNLLYNLLTGLWNFYELGDSEEVIQEAILDKKRPYIDPRYRNRTFAESALVNLIEKCWEHRAKDRPSIFQVMEYLREALKNDLKLRKKVTS